MLGKRKGNRREYLPNSLRKLEDNLFNIRNELDKRGLDDLANTMLDWEIRTDISHLVHPDLTDDLARELIDLAYDGI